MALSQQTFNDFAGAASDLFSGWSTEAADKTKAAGLRVEATDYRLAAGLAGENERYTETATALKSAAVQRQFEEASGKDIASIEGSGLSSATGGALDIIRSNTQQGALAKEAVNAQGQITEEGDREQMAAYTNMAAGAEAAANATENAGKNAALYGSITGGIKALAGIASLF